ncbi:MAG: DUF134 domain-containing protein [Oscillospiraceae bacterium]
MARPVKKRRICELPKTLIFAPCTNEKTETVEMTIDEYEVLRLIDYVGFNQNECALQMNVARTTVQAIYDTARKKVADALVNGKRLVIGGGSYDVCVNSQKCCGKNCGKRPCEDVELESGNLKCKGCTCTYNPDNL